MFRQQHGQRIGFFTRGAAGAPDPDRICRFLVGQDLGNDLLTQVFPGIRIPEEAGHVDQDRVEEASELVRMHLEIVAVVVEGLNPNLLHSLFHPPQETRPLVPSEVKAADTLEIFQQVFKGGVGLILLHRTSLAPFSDQGRQCAGDFIQRQDKIRLSRVNGGRGHPGKL